MAVAALAFTGIPTVHGVDYEHQTHQKQSQLMGYIRKFTAEHGISPTYIDMGKHFNVHPSSAQMVELLINKGYLRQVRV